MANSLRVGVVGCGIAGLTAAFELARRNHRVTLIERAPRLGPVGAGLLLQPSGQLALRELGLLDAVIARAEAISGLHAWTHRNRTLVHLPYQKIGARVTGYGVHRNDIFSVLHDRAMQAGVSFVLGITIASSRQTQAEIVAIDESGKEHGPFDLLIAADGSRSRLREEPRLRARVREFPLEAAWFSGRCDRVRGVLHQVTRSTRQLIGMLPLGEGRCGFFCALPRGGKESLRSAEAFASLKREIVELCPMASELIEQVSTIDDLACAKYQLVRLSSWNAGRLVCIGDAAHSTTPHLGQGVNLALLDALAVAREVGSSADIVAALHRAADFRRRQVMWCWRLSNMLGPVFQNEGWLLGAARDRVLPLLPGLPWVGPLMVGTMAGLRTGMFKTLEIRVLPSGGATLR